MEKVVLKIGDSIELWNNSRGIVSGLEYPMITITSPVTYPQTFHMVNVKYINDVFIGEMDIIFE